MSGNPAGRPKGARNAATLAAEALLDGEAEALRLCMDRICPPRKDRPVSFPLRPINSARDAADALSDVAAAVSSGKITPCDADAISKVLGHAAKAFEIADTANATDLIRKCSDAELYRILRAKRH